MRFEPVYLGFADCTICESDSSNALHLPPTSPAVSALQIAPDVYGPAGCNCLNVSNLADDLKFYHRSSSHRHATHFCSGEARNGLELSRSDGFFHRPFKNPIVQREDCRSHTNWVGGKESAGCPWGK